MVVNFFVGHPTHRLFPDKVISEASVRLLCNPRPFNRDNDTENRHPLNYGSDPGAKYVRELIGNWTSDFYKTEKINPDNIVITCGASYGILNGLLLLTSPITGYTKQAFIISPTYFLANASFRDAGFSGRVTTIGEGENGCDLEQLKRELQLCEEKFDDIPYSEGIKPIEDPERPKKIYKYVLYCVPTFSNPSGGTMDLKTRIELIKIARKYDMLIISDDVYDMLNYSSEGETPLPRLVTLDRETLKDIHQAHGNTISNCSFSKLLGAGIRVGWQESVSPILATQLAKGGSNHSGGCPSQLNSMIVGELIKSGELNKNIENLNKVFKERATFYRNEMQKELPTGTEILGGVGGYFFWVNMPSNIDTKKMVQISNERGVKLASGGNFETIGKKLNWENKSVRISISFEEIDAAKQGIAIWGQVCKELLASKKNIN